MKDNFSTQAAGYAKFRPTYPPEMVKAVVELAPGYEQALDVATGNGQIAIMLADHFHTVYATDISEKQLSHAAQAINVIYRELPAEETDFEDGQFDLITVAQAVHWFDFDLFYGEVYRTLKPDGVLAIIGYGLFRSNPDTDAIIRDFYENIVGPYWDPERRYLDENYATLPFPFEEIEMPSFETRVKWDSAQLLGYLETWSAVTHYKAHFNENPIDIIREKVEASWNKGDGHVIFPLLLRVGKRNG